MATMIYVDARGREKSRKVVGRGRPPLGAVRQDNGDFKVFPVPEKPKTFYLTLDKIGRVARKVVKGRGRTKPEFVLQTDGKHKGHYVKAK